MIIKKLLFAIILILSINAAFSQQQVNQETIIRIDKTISIINQCTAYDTIILKDEEFLDSAFIHQPSKGVGRLIGFYKNGELCKIIEHIGISLLHDFATTEYYFSAGKLIYVNASENIGPDVFIDSLGTIDYRLDKPNFEVKYYFENNSIIFETEAGTRQSILVPNEDFFDSQSMQGHLLEIAQKYANLLKGKD